MIENNLQKFRDLSYICTKDIKIRRGLIFRSRQLVDFENLNSLLIMKNISSIIDFRTEKEILKYEKYPPSVFEKINYYNIPIECEGILVDEDYKLKKGYDGYEYLYHHIVTHEKNSIGKFLTLLANKNNYPLVIHCIAGKDRTGIITAILFATLNVNSDTIVRDYMTTPNTERKNIVHLFNLIEQEGGIETYVKKCGVNDDQISLIRNNLLV